MTKKSESKSEAKSGQHNTAENVTNESNLDYATTLDAGAQEAGELAVTAAQENEPEREFNDEELKSIRDEGRAAYMSKVEAEDDEAKQAFCDATPDSTGDKLLQVLYKKHVIGWNDIKHILK